jgi:hypothetical protein
LSLSLLTVFHKQKSLLFFLSMCVTIARLYGWFLPMCAGCARWRHLRVVSFDRLQPGSKICINMLVGFIVYTFFTQSFCYLNTHSFSQVISQAAWRIRGTHITRDHSFPCLACKCSVIIYWDPNLCFQHEESFFLFCTVCSRVVVFFSRSTQTLKAIKATRPKITIKAFMKWLVLVCPSATTTIPTLFEYCNQVSILHVHRFMIHSLEAEAGRLGG